MKWLHKNRFNLAFVMICFGGAAWAIIQQGFGIDITPW